MPDRGAPLRAVGAEPAQPEASPPTPRGNRLVALLAALLAVTLALLVWSRLELGQRIGALEDQARELRATVEAREATIDAQRDTIAAHERRLADVGESLAEVLELLEAPVE